MVCISHKLLAQGTHADLLKRSQRVEVVMKLTVMRMFSTTEWYSSSFRNPSNGEKPLQSVTCTTFSIEHHFDTCTDLLLILTQQ